MFEPLFKVHTTVGMILNGFLKTTATVCVLFAAISTAPVVPDCVLLFYIKIIMPVGLTLAVDFVVIVTINCFLSQENENILFEKFLFNENAIFFSDL